MTAKRRPTSTKRDTERSGPEEIAAAQIHLARVITHNTPHDLATFFKASSELRDAARRLLPEEGLSRDALLALQELYESARERRVEMIEQKKEGTMRLGEERYTMTVDVLSEVFEKRLAEVSWGRPSAKEWIESSDPSLERTIVIGTRKDSDKRHSPRAKILFLLDLVEILGANVSELEDIYKREHDLPEAVAKLIEEKNRPLGGWREKPHPWIKDLKLKDPPTAPAKKADLEELRQGEFYKAKGGELLDIVQEERVRVLKPGNVAGALAAVAGILESHDRTKKTISKDNRLPYACLILQDLIKQGFPTGFTTDELLHYTIVMGLVVDPEPKRHPDDVPRPPGRETFLVSLASELREEKATLEHSRDEKSERLKLYLQEHLAGAPVEKRDVVLEDNKVREALRLLDKRVVVDEDGSVRLKDRRGVPDLSELPEDPVKALGRLTDALGQIPREEAIEEAQRYLNQLVERFPLPGRGRRTAPPPYPFDSGEHVAGLAQALQCLACRIRCAYGVAGREVSFWTRPPGVIDVREKESRRSISAAHGLPQIEIIA